MNRRTNRKHKQERKKRIRIHPVTIYAHPFRQEVRGREGRVEEKEEKDTHPIVQIKGFPQAMNDQNEMCLDDGVESLFKSPGLNEMNRDLLVHHHDVCVLLDT